MMRGHSVLVVMAGVSAVLGAAALTAPYAVGAEVVPAVPGAVSAASSWGKAIAVPGLAALGGSSLVLSVSCGLAGNSSGNCAAVGTYNVGGRSQGFVVSERHGRWGEAIKMPAVGALYAGGGAAVDDVSCVSAGYCAAGGFYRDRRGHAHGFVVAKRRGRWRLAIEVPGLGALNKGDAGVSSVSCTSAGNCTAVGGYTDKARNQQGFVVAEKNGVWGKAVALPGLAALGGGGVSQVSCSSVGNCAAGGFYSDKAGGQGWVATEKSGVWGTAIAVPGLEALNKGGDAAVNSVSCGAVGSCAAVGVYTDNGDNGQGWVATEKNGVWGTAFEPPGLAGLNGSSGGGNAETDSVSCPSAGNCTAAGTYGEPYGVGFVAVEKNGIWRETTNLGLDGGRVNGANVVSCGSPGNCAAGGFDSNDIGSVNQAWVSAERHGRWDGGIGVPGLRALNKGGDADVETVSCPLAGSCVAAGYYSTSRGDRTQGFVVSQTG